MTYVSHIPARGSVPLATVQAIADRRRPSRVRRYRLPVASLLALGLLLFAPTATRTPAGADELVSNRSADQPAPQDSSPVFILDNGEFAELDVPFGAAGGDAVGINNRGEIVGGYYSDNDSSCLRGFLRDRRGRFTRIDIPHSTGITQPVRINDRGQIVGNHRPGPCAADAPPRGFLRDERGRFTTIRVPGAVQPRRSASTTAARWWALRSPGFRSTWTRMLTASCCAAVPAAR